MQRLIFLVENTFTHGGAQQHELGHYFLATFSENAVVCSRSGPFPGVERDANLEFCWFDRQQLDSINLRPSFLASALAASQLEFKHVVVGPGETEV